MKKVIFAVLMLFVLMFSIVFSACSNETERLKEQASSTLAECESRQKLIDEAKSNSSKMDELISQYKNSK